MSSIAQADHIPMLHATFAIPDTRVREAMLFFAPKEVHNIADAIRIGHKKLNANNKVSEFKKIGVTIPEHFYSHLEDLNDPVYQFCKAIRKYNSVKPSGNSHKELGSFR